MVLLYLIATDDKFETTLTVVDPITDRTVTLPNTSGTVIIISDPSTSVTTLPDDLLIKDIGTIGIPPADVMTPHQLVL